MTKLLTAAAVLLSLVSSVNAAEIFASETKSKDRYPVIVIRGDIEADDDDKFTKVLAKMPRGKTPVVVLTSTGGALIAGLNIGLAIQRAKLSTVAVNMCASACGYIWLAGKERGAYSDTKLGFHGAYDKDTKVPTSVGNALIGAYMTRLGFGFEAVVWATKSAHDKAEWLNASVAKEYSIPFTLLKD